MLGLGRGLAVPDLGLVSRDLVNPSIALGSEKVPSSVFSLKIFSTKLSEAILRRFLNMNGTQRVAVRSSIGAPEVLGTTPNTGIILNLAKFYAHVDSYSQMPPKYVLL